MAKEDQGSWLHQHVEKVVLGATVGLLLVIVGRWVISSPRQVQGFRPDQIDEAQRLEAEKVKKRHDNAEVPGWPRPDVLKELAERTDNPIPPVYRMDMLTAALPPTTFPDVILGPDEGPSLADVTKSILAPERPEVWLGHELPLPKGAEKLDDKFVSHVAAVLDVGKISDGWAETVAGTRIDPAVIFHAVEAQVQQMRPDGTWGPARPVKMRIPELLNEDGEPDPVAPIPPFDGKNSDDIQLAIDAVKDDFIQTYILEPGYPDIYLPDYGWVTWRVHLPETRVSRDARKLQEQEQEEPVGRAKSTPRLRTPARRPAKTAPRLRTPARRPGSSDPLRTISPDDFRKLMERGGRPGADPRTTRRPPRVPIKKRAPIKKPPTGTEKTIEELTEPVVPSRAQQMRDGALLVWFHDVSLKSGSTYRYRLRLMLLNPLYTRAADVKKGSEKDATIARIATPWSPWSDGKRVTSLTEFYVSGHTSTAEGKKINVEVFSHSLGQRVVKRFTVRKGEVIGQEARVEVTDPLDHTIVTKNVDFATGAIAVSFDFRRRIYKGKNLDAAYTTAMLYLDDNGRLQVRTLHDDTRNKAYKKLGEEARRTAEAVSAAKSGEQEARR